jgi:hypothetical protein
MVWAGPATSQHLLRLRLQHSLPIESFGSGHSAFDEDFKGSSHDFCVMTEADDNIMGIVGERRPEFLVSKIP